MGPHDKGRPRRKVEGSGSSNRRNSAESGKIRGTGGKGRQPSSSSRGAPVRGRGGPGGPRAAAERVPKPPLPDDRPGLPRGLRREIANAVGAGPKANDVISAVALGIERLEDDDVPGALAYLRWARQEAGTAAAVREVVGVAHYLAGEWESARKELLAYRRMSERADQNHLIADSLRALRRDLDDIPDLIEAMKDAPLEARLEGRIVWASHVADEGDPLAAIAVLAPAVADLESPDAADLPDGVAARVWYVAGDLAQRAGRDREAVRWFKRVVEAGDEWDAGERLQALQD